MAERALEVEALVLGGVERAVHVEEGELAIAGPDDACAPRGHVARAGDGMQLPHRHRARTVPAVRL